MLHSRLGIVKHSRAEEGLLCGDNPIFCPSCVLKVDVLEKSFFSSDFRCKRKDSFHGGHVGEGPGQFADPREAAVQDLFTEVIELQEHVPTIFPNRRILSIIREEI